MSQLAGEGVGVLHSEWRIRPITVFLPPGLQSIVRDTMHNAESVLATATSELAIAPEAIPVKFSDFEGLSSDEAIDLFLRSNDKSALIAEAHEMWQHGALAEAAEISFHEDGHELHIPHSDRVDGFHYFWRNISQQFTGILEMKKPESVERSSTRFSYEIVNSIRLVLAFRDFDELQFEQFIVECHAMHYDRQIISNRACLDEFHRLGII